MSKTILRIVVGLVAGVALYLPASSQAQVGGWVFDPPRSGYPNTVYNVQEDPAGTAILTFDAGVNGFGAWLDVHAPTSSSYTTTEELYCTTGWTNAITHSNVSGTTAGDIVMYCDWVNGIYGAAAFYFGDT